MDAERVLLAGDWHGNTNFASSIIERAARLGVKRVVQLGDFGAWEHESGGLRYLDDLNAACERRGVTVYWLDGNHDKWSLTLSLHGHDRDPEGFVRCQTRVRYVPRGHTWEWGGTRFLALGGAHSVDKRWRVERETIEFRRRMDRVVRYGASFDDPTESLWFPEEEITEEQEARAIVAGRVDVLLTHDKPSASQPPWNRYDLVESRSNQERVERVMRAVQPVALVHGHLHFYYTHTLPLDLETDRWVTVTGLAADVEEDDLAWDREDTYRLLTLGDPTATLVRGDGR